jgi:DNA mismatch repair ATPase MutS
MRQTALIVLMAQIAALCPRRLLPSAIVDALYTESALPMFSLPGSPTFMVEMTEVAQISGRRHPKAF